MNIVFIIAMSRCVETGFSSCILFRRLVMNSSAQGLIAYVSSIFAGRRNDVPLTNSSKNECISSFMADQVHRKTIGMISDHLEFSCAF